MQTDPVQLCCWYEGQRVARTSPSHRSMVHGISGYRVYQNRSHVTSKSAISLLLHWCLATFCHKIFQSAHSIVLYAACLVFSTEQIQTVLSKYYELYAGAVHKWEDSHQRLVCQLTRNMMTVSTTISEQRASYQQPNNFLHDDHRPDCHSLCHEEPSNVSKATDKLRLMRLISIESIRI